MESKILSALLVGFLLVFHGSDSAVGASQSSLSRMAGIGVLGDPDYTLIASPDEVHPGEDITVSWTALAGETNPQDWIGMYKLGASGSQYTRWKYTGGATSGSVIFEAPDVSERTVYEFRYLPDDGDEAVATSNPVTVSPWPPLEVNLSASPRCVAAGGAITVTWHVSQGQSLLNDWIGMFQPDASNYHYISYKYTQGVRDGSFTFTAPSTEGPYEFRYLPDGGYTDVATSNTVTVGLCTNTLTIDISPEGSGTVRVEPESPLYAEGEEVLLTATATAGYAFSHWSGSLYSTANPTILTMNGDHHITANFHSGVRMLTVSSAAGGTVIDPGEETFSFQDGAVVPVQASVSADCVFVGWVGTAVTEGKLAEPKAAVTEVAVDGDYTLRATFATLLELVYVDDNAPNDPGPNTPAISDPDENGSYAHPFDEIGEAIEVSVDGVTVRVREGTYYETLSYQGKRIVVTSWEPNDPCTVSDTVIDANSLDTVVTFDSGEDANSVLHGFILTGGRGELAGAICCIDSSPTIINCLIAGNRVVGDSAGAVYLSGSDGVIGSCTLADNFCGASGAGLYCESSSPLVANSILWGNWPAQIKFVSAGAPLVAYSDVQGGWSGWKNTSGDPRFVEPGHWIGGADLGEVVMPDEPDAIWVAGDCHLRSEAGRWDSLALCWVRDNVTSPCIDAGDPEEPVGEEPEPNAGRINLGAYGGTPEASKSQ